MPTLISGRARLVRVSDIDTDMIFHNRHLHITDPKEMGKYIFGNLPGHEDFASSVRTGDILIVGQNFGCGSSRQQAVDGFVALGIAAIVGESFGAIYKRNAINAGWPLIEAAGVLDYGISEGEDVAINLVTGGISRKDGTPALKGKPFTEVQMAIYQAGGLLELI